MSESARTIGPAGSLRDPAQRHLRGTVLLVTAVAAVASASAGVLHTLQPHGAPMDRVLPWVMAVAFVAIALHYWRRPERLRFTVWSSWAVAIGGLAAPVWVVALDAWSGQRSLVAALPPITAVLLPLLLIMVVFARPRFAWWACAIAWLSIAAPVLTFLMYHPAELWTPRGLDMAIAFGPASLFIPLLIPFLRGVERRIESLQHDGERLQVLAERDVLSGLYNRRAGERFLATLLANTGAGAALVLFDLDHFKRINDTHGHPAGDAVLVEIGRRCAALLDAGDIFARWGGEEFLVVLPGAGRERGERLARQMREAVRTTPIAQVGVVTASFGVTGVTAGDTLAQVLQRADEALYRAKANGRDRVEWVL